MNVILSKSFNKALHKLSGKELRSVLQMIDEVEKAKQIEDITDCKKLTGFMSVYRIRVGNRRAFFTFHIELVNDDVYFHYLVSRGQAYDKAMNDNLKMIDASK